MYSVEGGSGSEVCVRRARPADEAARAALLRAAYHEHFSAAFLMFFVHEVTLQAVVLCGAVLFIFCGWSVAACAALPALAGGAVGAAVWLAHEAAAGRARAALRAELAGWVAEARGRLVGTLSMEEWRGEAARGALRGLYVAPAWRRRGVARKLLAQARAAAAQAGLHSLEAVVSALQAPARGALHAAGWPLRGSYERALLAGAATLPMLQLGLDLPAP